MKIELAKIERMSQTGSSLLRLMQNNHMPILDLFMKNLSKIALMQQRMVLIM